MTRAATYKPEVEWTDAAHAGVFEAIDGAELKDLGRFGHELPTKTTAISAIRYVEDPDSGDERELLVVSPYHSRSHLLDLSSVSLENQLMARSLTSMRAVRYDYATVAYDMAFNWPDVVEYLRSLLLAEKHSFGASRFYIVVFRSQVPRSTDRSRLGVLDELAHEEAMQSGGLLKYWFGTPDKKGRNLATCKSRQETSAAFSN